MVVSQDTRDYIVTHFEDFTAKELAEKFNISKSSVTRIIKQGREDAAKLKADSKDGAGAGAEDKPEKKPGEQANDDFEWKPDTDEKEVIEIETDDNLHKLLRSAPQHDMDEEDDGGALTMAETKEGEGEEAKEADKSSVHKVMEQLTEPDDQEIDSLLTGLLGPGDPLAPAPAPAPKPARKKAPAAKSRAVAPAPAPSVPSGKARPPASVLVAQIRLYVQHFGPQLAAICGAPGSAEQERWLKGVTLKTPYDELCGHMSALRGTLVILNGVNAIRSSVMCACGVAETTAPYVGMQLQGLTDELAQKKDELELVATQMCIDEWDFYSEKMSPKHQLFMMVTSTAFACHNRNAALAAQYAQQQAAAQASAPVSDEVQTKFQTL